MVVVIVLVFVDVAVAFVVVVIVFVVRLSWDRILGTSFVVAKTSVAKPCQY